jgi:dTDP-4-amino-4,6-dideoxygalactose transaminase
MPVLAGGDAIRPEGPPAWPLPDEDVQQAIRQVIRDGSWGSYHGPNIPRLEADLRDSFGVEFAHLCGSGTFAVELALRALKIGPGDEVVMAAYDYPGNFLNIHAVGASPVLIDVDPDNWNLAPENLAGALGPNTRCLIVSHLHGGLVPMSDLMAFAREHHLAVIEDAAQAPGAVVGGKKVGAWGDAGILSFGGSKLLSAGRGGALLTSRADLSQRARTWRQRGNLLCPMSEIQAAVLVPQLARLEARNARRFDHVKLLLDLLRDVPGLAPLRNQPGDQQPGYYKVGFQYDAAQFGLSRSRFTEAMRAEGIALDEGFSAVHVGRSPRRFRQVGPLPNSQRAGEGMVVLHHPVLLGTEEDIVQVATAVRKVHEHRAALSPGEPGV